MSWPSSHIGSYQLNGTYSSATSISLRGSVIPAWRYTSWAHSTPAWGRTGLRPGKGSELAAHRGGLDPRRRAAATRRAAGLVGEDHGAGAVRGRAGLEEAERVPQHRGLLDLLEGDVGQAAGGRRDS